jgi:hypothetical protein
MYTISIKHEAYNIEYNVAINNTKTNCIQHDVIISSNNTPTVL